MAGKRFQGILKAVFIDPGVYILGDLAKQSPVMWVFVIWGWLAILVMVTSFVSELL